MGQTLNQLEHRLERLEAAVVQEYSSRKLDALRDGQERIVLDEGRIDRFAAELGQLEAALYATGDPRKLQIVSEQHDAIRIRMICLQHILEREIPKPYADQTLFEGDRAFASAGRTPASSRAPTRTSFLGRVFSSEPSPKPAPAPRAPQVLPNHMRINQLHKLMEEDKQHLMKADERPPRVTNLPPISATSTPPSEAAYRFKVKFIAETHHGQRVANEKIARTPEELRAKLAKRASDEEKK